MGMVETDGCIFFRGKKKREKQGVMMMMDDLLQQVHDHNATVHIVQQLGDLSRDTDQRLLLRERRSMLLPLIETIMETRHSDDEMNSKIMRLLTNLAYESVETANWIVSESQRGLYFNDIYKYIT